MSDTDRYSPESVSTYPRRRPKSRVVRWFLACIGLIVVIGTVLGAWGWIAFTSQARTALNENALIQAHIGEIREMHFNLSRTVSEAGDNVFAFDIIGTKGTGTVAAEFITIDAETERIASGVVRLANGDEYVLVPKR